MNVSVNGMRMQMVDAYNNICSILNRNIREDDPIDPDVLQEDMDHLATLIGVFCACYQDDDPDFQDISGKVRLNEFNP